MVWVTQIHFPNVIYFDNSMERHESLQGGLQVNIHRQAPSSKSETITIREDRFEVANLMTF